MDSLGCMWCGQKATAVCTHLWCSLFWSMLVEVALNLLHSGWDQPWLCQFWQVCTQARTLLCVRKLVYTKEMIGKGCTNREHQLEPEKQIIYTNSCVAAAVCCTLLLHFLWTSVVTAWWNTWWVYTQTWSNTNSNVSKTNQTWHQNVHKLFDIKAKLFENMLKINTSKYVNLVNYQINIFCKIC